MKKKILALLIGLLLLVSCSSVEDQPLLPMATLLPATPTIAVAPTATHPIASAAETTQVSTPTEVQATEFPWGYEIEANLDGSWFYELNLFDDHYLKIFEKGNSIPVVDIDLYAYFPDYPDRSSYSEFSNPSQSPRGGGPVWSPDGRYLAFVGAIDGPSADLYVFDTLSQKVSRLTNGINQAESPEFSPDGKWILHAEVSDFLCCDGYEAVWAARPDGSEVKWLLDPKGWFTFIGWVGDNVFFSADGHMGGDTALWLTNIDQGKVITAFDATDGVVVPTGFSFDPVSGAVVYRFSQLGPISKYENVELYISTPSQPYPRLFSPYLGKGTEWEDSWDEELDVYVSSIPCDENGEKYFAITTQTPDKEVFCVEYAP